MATAKQVTQAPQAPQEEDVVNTVVDEAAAVAPKRYFTIRAATRSTRSSGRRVTP